MMFPHTYIHTHERKNIRRWVTNNWSDVQRKIVLSRYQPVVLLYANPGAGTVLLSDELPAGTQWSSYQAGRDGSSFLHRYIHTYIPIDTYIISFFDL